MMPVWRLRTGRFQTVQVFPKMVGNLFWEHGHRMVATAVGMLTDRPGAFTCRFANRRAWVKRLGWAALA